MKKTPPFRFLSNAGRVCLTLCLLGGLAACGGGGATTPAVQPPTTPTTPTTPTLPTGAQTGPEMRTGAAGLISTYAPTNPPVYTALTLVPTTGSATYRGYLYGDLANQTDAVTDTLIGGLTMQVGYTATSVAITGAAENFVDAANAPLTGSLALSGAQLNRAGNPANDATLTVAAGGTLTDGGGRQLAIGLQLEGDFLGGAGGAIGGEALGRVTVNGASQNFDGGFIAAQ